MSEFSKMVVDSAFSRASTATYRIDGMGGPIATNLASVSAAKDRYLQAVRDGLDDDEIMPDVQFRITTDHPDCDGECEEHIECIEGGSVDACIWLENPVWPQVSYDYRGRRDRELAMVLDTPSLPFPSCQHRRLLCMTVGMDDSDADDNAPRPGIICVDCYHTWSPAPMVGAEIGGKG